MRDRESGSAIVDRESGRQESTAKAAGRTLVSPAQKLAQEGKGELGEDPPVPVRQLSQLLRRTEELVIAGGRSDGLTFRVFSRQPPT